jgi:hypothetical protein
MGSSEHRAAVIETIEQFQSDLERLTFALAREVLRQHLDVGAPGGGTPRSMREPAAEPAPERKVAGETKRASRHQPAPEPSRPQEAEQLELEWLEEDHAEQAAAQPSEPAVEPPSRQDVSGAASTKPIEVRPIETAPLPIPEPTGRGKQSAWTRDRIIEELVTWMSKGTVVDAQFVRQHGPPGLATATRRIFGRIDAALNLALIEVSKRSPDGPVKR